MTADPRHRPNRRQGLGRLYHAWHFCASVGLQSLVCQGRFPTVGAAPFAFLVSQGRPSTVGGDRPFVLFGT